MTKPTVHVGSGITVGLRLSTRALIGLPNLIITGGLSTHAINVSMHLGGLSVCVQSVCMCLYLDLNLLISR